MNPLNDSTNAHYQAAYQGHWPGFQNSSPQLNLTPTAQKNHQAGQHLPMTYAGYSDIYYPAYPVNQMSTYSPYPNYAPYQQQSTFTPGLEKSSVSSGYGSDSSFLQGAYGFNSSFGSPFTSASAYSNVSNSSFQPQSASVKRKNCDSFSEDLSPQTSLPALKRSRPETPVATSTSAAQNIVSECNALLGEDLDGQDTDDELDLDDLLTTSSSRDRKKRILNRDQRIAANKRERKRMNIMNDSFAVLRAKLPISTGRKRRKMSRIDIVLGALDYIEYLGALLESPGPITIDFDGFLQRVYDYAN